MQVNWRFVIIAVVLIWAVSFVGGAIFGAVHMHPGALITNLASVIAGLTLVGCMTPEKRWIHIMLVGAGLWITSALNIALGITTFPVWILSIVFMAIFVGVSGLISMLIGALIRSAAKT